MAIPYMVALFNEGYTIRHSKPIHLFDRVHQETIRVHTAELVDPQGKPVMSFQSSSLNDAVSGLIQKVNK